MIASEALKLLDGNSATVRNRAMFELLYGSGLRASELRSVQLSDLHLEDRVLVVHGKGDKDRTVPLGMPAVRLLREYLASRRLGSPYIFVSEPNGRPSAQLTRQWIWRLVRDHGKAAGLVGVKPHTLRHSCATAMLEGGADLRTIQTVLGHADINTTQIYTHTSTKHIRAEYDKLLRRRKLGQMAFMFQEPPQTLRPCADCMRPAVAGKSRCEVHLILSRERSRRWYERQKGQPTIKKPVRSVPRKGAASGTG